MPCFFNCAKTQNVYITLYFYNSFKNIKNLMQYEGVLNKMYTEFLNPIQYYLVFEQAFIHMNQVINKQIEIQHIGYVCLNCKKEKKIFRQGFCYDCFMKSARSEEHTSELQSRENLVCGLLL